ncbi:MAG: Hsp20/alpha crystallin family protein [Gallionellaceae bacterium]|nr:MAG: Hsp20/alpha crystallin family protein [Gallionellaceae bacterium]
MNLIKWDPFRELEEVSTRLNRIFGRAPSPDSSQDLLAIADWLPSTDVSETDSEYLIKVEIPGVNKEDVKVFVQDGLLTMQGERKMDKEEKGKKFHRIERSYGRFVRSFRIPDDADENTVKAEFKDGMLNVKLSNDLAPVIRTS